MKTCVSAKYISSLFNGGMVKIALVCIHRAASCWVRDSAVRKAHCVRAVDCSKYPSTRKRLMGSEPNNHALESQPGAGLVETQITDYSSGWQRHHWWGCHLTLHDITAPLESNDAKWSGLPWLNRWNCKYYACCVPWKYGGRHCVYSAYHHDASTIRRIPLPVFLY